MKKLALMALSMLAWLAGCDTAPPYQRQGGQWRYEKTPFNPADPASFKPLGPVFARDKLRGYYRGVEIENSQGPSFEALSEHEARDRSSVFWADTYRKGQEYYTVRHVRVQPILGASPASYRSLGYGYGSDGRSAFYEGLPFQVRDPASLVVIDGRFAHDAQRAYYERVEIAGSDGASFALVDLHEAEHARDRSQVFHAHMQVPAVSGPGQMPKPVVRVLRGANPATVEVLGRGYARDGQRVWWRGLPLAGVDATSFEVSSQFAGALDARDARSVYAAGVRRGPAAAAAASSPR